MDLKVGDKVVIIKDLIHGKQDGKVFISKDMTRYAGLVATILEERYPGVYKIDLDNKGWSWHKFMFEEKVEGDNMKSKYKVLYEKPYYVNDYVKKVIVNGNATIVFLETGEKGIAKCNPNDQFKVDVGYEIARSRAMVKHYHNLIKGEKDFEKDFIEYLY